MPHYVIVDKDLLDADDDSSIMMHKVLQLRAARGRSHHVCEKFTEALSHTNTRLYLYAVRLVSVGDGTMFTGTPKTKKAPSRSSKPMRVSKRFSRAR